MWTIGFGWAVCMLYYTWLLITVSTHRTRLFTSLLLIPHATIEMLASRPVKIDDDVRDTRVAACRCPAPLARPSASCGLEMN